MRTASCFVLFAVSTATACNCSHKGNDCPTGLCEAIDSTPDATPNPLDFGNVPIGGSEAKALKLTDLGGLPLDISSVTIVQGSDAGAPQFTFAPLTNPRAPFGTSVQPGGDAGVSLVFQPSQGGEQTATLVIASNSNATPDYDVVLKGNGINVSIVVQPPAVDFGNVQVGTTQSVTVTLTNEGTSTSDPITLQPVSGTQAAEFGYTGAAPATGLAPGQKFSIQATFSPTQQGSASALIGYLICASCKPSNIALTGVGVDGQLVYNPNPINFSNVPIGSTVTSGTVTLTNVGTAAVQLNDFALDSPSSVYTLTGVATLPITLQPLASTTFGVSYTAASTSDPADAVDATWVPLDATGVPVVGISPHIASDPITGNGTANPCSLSIVPPAFNFGNVTVGNAVQKSVTVTNTGDQQCAITNVALAASSDPAFSLINPPTSFTLTPGQNQALTVQCDVTVAGNPLLRKGALTFVSTDTQPSNVSVPLSAFLQGKGPYQNGWPKWHNDNTDQGQSDADTSGNQGTLVWQFRVGVPQSGGGPGSVANPNPTYMNSPVVDASGNVYQLGMDGTFYGITPGGTEWWTASLLPPNPDEHPATPIIAADSTIYIETGTDGATLNAAQMYHIAADGGAILFQAGPPTGIRNAGSQSAGADGFDVNPSIGNGGMLFDGDDFGQTVTYTLNADGTFTQANEIILQFYGERVAVAIDASDNSYWCCLNACFGVTAPGAGFGLISGWTTQSAANYMGANIGNAPGGATTWVNSDLAFDENHTGWLIVEAGMQTGSTGNTEVVAMDPANGSLHWDVTLPSGPTPGSWNLLTEVGIFSSDVGNSAPAIATFPGQSNDGNVYVGNVDGLYALDGATGATIWKYAPSQDSGANADVDTAPAIGGDGTIFFGTAGGTFYAVNPDGSERFHYTTGGRISSSPAIGPDGTVFFVSDDGQLYAIR